MARKHGLSHIVLGHLRQLDARHHEWECSWFHEAPGEEWLLLECEVQVLRGGYKLEEVGLRLR